MSDFSRRVARARRKPKPQKHQVGRDRVEQYALDVVAGDIVAGPHVRLACQRHLDDLEHGHKRGLKWRQDLADRACDFFPSILRLVDKEDESTGLSAAATAGSPFFLADWQVFIIGSLFGWTYTLTGARRFRTAYIEAGKGSGKALALDTEIPTPGGWSTMADLRVGDAVFDDLGYPCEVLATSEIMQGRPCYRLTFDDGTSVVADADHQWMTEARYSGRRKGEGSVLKGVAKSQWGDWRLGVRTTSEIAASLRYPNGDYQSANHSIALAGGLRIAPANLPIPPYALGVWLGDGDSDCARFTCAFSDAQIVNEVEKSGVPVVHQKRHSGTTGRYSLSDGVRRGRPADREKTFSAKLRRLGVFGSKHIPAQYLRASFEQRLDLARGLLDTDGTISKRSGQIEFSVTSERLARDFLELVHSLGIKAALRVGGAFLAGKPCGDRYRITFHAPPDLLMFRLDRKARRQVQRHSRRRLSGERRIISCDMVPSVPVRCIRVSSPSSLFLCTRAMIPTHNSPLAAGIGLYGLTADGEMSAEVYAAAVSRDQAGIMFGDAVSMVEVSRHLSSRLKVTSHGIAYPAKRGKFRPVSAEGRTLDGKRVHMALLDEIHEHRTPTVVDKMRLGVKGRKQPLIVEITNSGYDRTSVCWQHHEYSLKVLDPNQKFADDKWFAYVCGLDPKDDWRNEAVWPKSNPNIGVSLPLEYLRGVVNEAAGMPSRQNIVKRLNFCIWTEHADRWLDREQWERAQIDPFPLEYLRAATCYAGLDLSSVQDLTSLVLIFEDEDDNGNKIVHLRPWFWLPADGLKEREDRDGVPYQEWRDTGFLEVTPGEAVDRHFVAVRVNQILEPLNCLAIAYDRWRIEDFQNQLDSSGLELPAALEEYGQGWRDMGPAIHTFEELLANRQLRHTGHPILTMCAANAVCVQDPAGNKKWEKAKSTGRIDGIVAASMALGLWSRGIGGKQSIYETRGLTVI